MAIQDVVVKDVAKPIIVQWYAQYHKKKLNLQASKKIAATNSFKIILMTVAKQLQILIITFTMDKPLYRS